jgi:NTE family protein
MQLTFITTIFLSIISSINCNYNILAFSGAGSFGSVEIGILNKLSDSNSIVQKYDLYTGISAGGLNAGFLSHFTSIKDALPSIKRIMTRLSNRDIYKLIPTTNVSLLNTSPLEDTIGSTIKSLGSSKIQTLIGTTNLNTGYLDTFYYNTLELADQIKLLMATSAIPLVFPPISWKGQLYVDGGEIVNQMLEPITSNDFINVTYITTSGGIEPNYSIVTFEDIIKRNMQIVLSGFDNIIRSININCGTNKPRGIVYMYYVNSSKLEGYSSMNFNNGKELLDIGYNNVEYKTFNLC